MRLNSSDVHRVSGLMFELSRRPCRETQQRGLAETSRLRRRVRGALRCGRCLCFWRATLRFEDTLRGRGELDQLACWPNGMTDEFAAAVRASTVKPGVGTTRAERAFKRANARLAGLGRQVDVAAFTGRSELKHGGLDGEGCLQCSERGGVRLSSVGAGENEAPLRPG